MFRAECDPDGVEELDVIWQLADLARKHAILATLGQIGSAFQADPMEQGEGCETDHELILFHSSLALSFVVDE